MYSKLKAKYVCFRDITGCLDPKLPARKEELSREFLENRNIVYSGNDNVKQLKEQASRYIKNRKDDLRNEQCIVIQGVKVMAATCPDKDLAYFLSLGSIYEVILEFTDFKVSGTIRREISTNNYNSFPTGAVFSRTSYFWLT